MKRTYTTQNLCSAADAADLLEK